MPLVPLGQKGNGPQYNDFQTLAYIGGKYWDVNSTKGVYASSCEAFNAVTNPDANVFKAQYWVWVPANENKNDYMLVEKAPFKILQCNE